MTDTREREHDVVLIGATGFTGALTAEHLVRAAPDPARIAIAGRNRGKLEALRERLGVDMAIVAADVTDEASVRRLARSTRVLATTVGPYVRHGDPLVAACAAEGTDYADLTGEPEFVDRTYVRHDATARRTGARLVHACGFDSIPHDLGAQFTVEQLPADVPLRVRGYVSASGIPSGGTFESALLVMGRLPQTGRAHVERRRREQRPPGRRVRAQRGTPGYSADAGSWVLPLPTIDPQIVVRSAAALDRYGPDFSYAHYAAVGNALTAAGLSAGVAGMFVLAQTPPTRALLRRLRPSGSGPTQQQRDTAWFRVRFVGEGGGQRVVTEVRGGDPGYGATSVMLGEAALCLAYDDLPATRGQVTTAVAMGSALRERLDRNGITFRLVESR